jgi:hypothetical protein
LLSELTRLLENKDKFKGVALYLNAEPIIGLAVSVGIFTEEDITIGKSFVLFVVLDADVDGAVFNTIEATKLLGRVKNAGPGLSRTN